MLGKVARVHTLYITTRELLISFMVQALIVQTLDLDFNNACHLYYISLVDQTCTLRSH